MKQAQALAVMLSGESVFLTGPPGAGKTYVLNQFIKRAQRAGRRVAVTASTGIAATHIGGSTIHSWSGLGIRDQLSEYDKQWLQGNDRLIKRYNSVDVLVIDEISMLHGARLDMVNEACKLLRASRAPFGGLQIILVGDLFQLPPVNRLNELVDFAHMSAAWEELHPLICYLTEQHRQSQDALLDLLTAMRGNGLDVMHIEALESRKGVRPAPDVAVTRLYTHNVDVDTINQRHLQALHGEQKTFTMHSNGTTAKVEQLIKSVLAPEVLELRIGAEVMFVANDYTQGYVNGSRGQVVRFKDGFPLVALTDGRLLKVEPRSWKLTEDDKQRAEVVQLPLRLAWAITIHKSQGMSLDAAEIDLSRAFTPGMGYVALSRVRSIDGVYLSGINNLALQLHPHIYEFDRELQRQSAQLAERTPEASEEAPDDGLSASTRTYDEELFRALKVWRLGRARRDRVAPFMVVHNTTLQNVATQLPNSQQQLLGIKGFGPAKQAAYGDEILAVIREHQVTQAAESSAQSTVEGSPGESPQAIDVSKQKIFILPTDRHNKV